MRYRVMLLREMSQSIEVEADSAADAVRRAIDENDLSPNVSNRFEESGEVEPYNVEGPDGDVLWTSAGQYDDSWEGVE